MQFGTEAKERQMLAIENPDGRTRRCRANTKKHSTRRYPIRKQLENKATGNECKYIASHKALAGMIEGDEGWRD